MSLPLFFTHQAAKIKTGLNFTDAIIIKGSSDFEGTEKIWQYLDNRFGLRHEEWFFIKQSLLQTKLGVFDVMTIKLKNGDIQDFYFDISDTFGKGF